MALAGRVRSVVPGTDFCQHALSEGAMNFTHPHFAEPRWLWLAFLGPFVLCALYWYSGWARRHQLAQIASPHFLEGLVRSHSPLRRALKNTLLLMAVAGMGLALARPQW